MAIQIPMPLLASPEMVAAIAISGRLDFDPMNDTLINEDGEAVKLDDAIRYGNYH